jgi:hypothetical protein
VPKKSANAVRFQPLKFPALRLLPSTFRRSRSCSRHSEPAVRERNLLAFCLPPSVPTLLNGESLQPSASPPAALFHPSHFILLSLASCFLPTVFRGLAMGDARDFPRSRIHSKPRNVCTIRRTVSHNRLSQKGDESSILLCLLRTSAFRSRVIPSLEYWGEP